MSRICSVSCLAVICPLLVVLALAQSAPDSQRNTSENGLNSKLALKRSSPTDLEVSGELAGLSAGAKRFVRREDLLLLPQRAFTATDDPNFSGPVQVRGIELTVLARELAADGEKALVIGICKDWYRSFYPQTYREIHKPALALEINGQPPSGWPKGKGGFSLGPYLITHAYFKPSYKILSHEEESQIPWGVVQLEFRNESTAFKAIAPRGPNASDPAVQAGYHIAQENCLRCHGPESDEPLKGKLSWSGIAVFASQAPKNFAAYVRDPQALSKDAEMPGFPQYDGATLQALIAYFKTFASPEKR
jgi:mono/diheme cytochrome c family protein